METKLVVDSGYVAIILAKKTQLNETSRRRELEVLVHVYLSDTTDVGSSSFAAVGGSVNKVYIRDRR